MTGAPARAAQEGGKGEGAQEQTRQALPGSEDTVVLLRTFNGG
jgi:hypothetical protein